MSALLAFGGLATSSCHTERIVFQSDRSGQSEIYVVDRDGSHLSQLTSSPLMHEQPALSASALRAAFRVGNPGPNESLDLYWMLVTGGVETKIPTYLRNIAGPRWSHTGTEIAFSAAGAGTSAPDIYIVNIDGTSLRRLTNDRAADVEPSFSHDGQHILFTSTRGGSSDIWIMNADGSQPKQLTFDPGPDAEATFSQDDSKIAFWSRRAGNGDIFMMKADGSDPVDVSNDPALDFEPAFAPYSDEIAFSSMRDGNWEIYVVDLTTGDTRRITNSPGVDRAPDWR